MEHYYFTRLSQPVSHRSVLSFLEEKNSMYLEMKRFFHCKLDFKDEKGMFSTNFGKNIPKWKFTSESMNVLFIYLILWTLFWMQCVQAVKIRHYYSDGFLSVIWVYFVTKRFYLSLVWLSPTSEQYPKVKSPSEEKNGFLWVLQRNEKALWAVSSTFMREKMGKPLYILACMSVLQFS